MQCQGIMAIAELRAIDFLHTHTRPRAHTHTRTHTRTHTNMRKTKYLRKIEEM